MIELGGQAAERIQTTRLKTRLLYNFEGLTKFKNWKNASLTFDMEAGNALKNFERKVTMTKLS